MGRILIIDDDDQFRLMLKRLLELDGHEILEATDGKEGIRVYGNKRVDLVITDLIMPNMEGVETIIQLKRESPEIKIMALSGGGRNEPQSDLSMAKKLGANYTFEKPYARIPVMQAVEDLLGD